MATPYRRIKRLIVGIKEEGTRGTYADPDITMPLDAYCVFNADIPNLINDVQELECSNGTLTSGDDTVLVGDTQVKLSFDIAFPTELLSSADYSNYATYAEPIWKAAGTKFVTYGSGKKIIPEDLSDTAISVKYDVDGYTYKVRGMVAESVTVNIVAGKPTMARVSLIGTLESLSEAAPTEAGVVPNFSLMPKTTDDFDIAFTITPEDGGSAFNVKACAYESTFTIANTVVPCDTYTVGKGIAFYYIADRKILFDVKSTSYYLSSTNDDANVTMYDSFTAGDVITAYLSNKTANNILGIHGRILDYQPINKNGILAYDISIKHTGDKQSAFLVFESV